ncbi:hypothetical protein [Mesoterricola silvestris]|uniref:Uncharacterized protein n=1 Tax=Mesoterricola silvestris TaxID=2927979 RepID=A0AA48GKP1_9BACT|nr:hypothetical protein [Mesoterricola silvestris]BDU71519.1 hypothetical protein METEAL_06930 [Mesoterricola silvestris]
MKKAQEDPSQEQLDQLRHQIQEWRKARKGPGPMPEELWSRAVALAKAFGVCPIARALPLDYTALRKRVEKHSETGLVKPTFVELPATLAPVAPLPTTIEISARDGARMVIHLEAGRGMETASIVAAFLGSRG